MRVAPVPWREAWHDALYAAERGFYRGPGGPAAHFTTAAHGPTGAVLAAALLRLLDHRPTVVVDVGAGRGELATHLRQALDAGPAGPAGGPAATTRVVAVDVVDRPDGLDERIEWVRSPGGAALPGAALLGHLDDALVVAHEWLDVVPCAVAQVDAGGLLRELLVEPATGDESAGDPLTGAELDWCRAHWPASQPGARVEVGLARDRAWAGLVDRVRSGTLVAIDYAHTRAERPTGGTLAAYAGGRQVRPVPDGSCDLTAHVAVDSLVADTVATQRDVLRGLGVRGRPPAHHTASDDPIGYLRALETCSAEAELIDPHGFGAFRWAVKRVGAAP